MGAKLDQLMVHAGNVLRAAKKIDFERVIEHHEPSVDYLHQVLEVACGETERIKELGMLADDPGLQNSAIMHIGSDTDIDNDAERKRMNIELINDMGYGQRIGKVYSSLEDRGAVSFKGIGKTSGLPAFELVLMPDKSAANCVSGIFLDEFCVSLASLRYPLAANDWQVKLKKPYADPMEMLDLIKRFVTHGVDELH